MSLDGDDEKLISKQLGCILLFIEACCCAISDMIANHLFLADDDLQSDDSYATYDKKKKKGATAGGATAGGAADGAEGESKGFSKKCKIVTGVAVVLVILVIALVLIIGALKPKVPDAPASLTRNDELTNTKVVAFSWDAPSDDGGEVVIDYSV